MNIPQIQILKQSGILGIDADLGQQDIRQPKATFEIATTPPKLNIHAENGTLTIDSSRAYEALGRGPVLETLNKIYSQAKNVALQGIAKIVENGNRMAQISNPANAFAEIAGNQALDFFEFEFMGDASVNNVVVHYRPGKLYIQVEEGKVDLNTHPNPPEINYTRGKLDIYMMQYPKIEIIPPQIDIKA